MTDLLEALARVEPKRFRSMRTGQHVGTEIGQCRVGPSWQSLQGQSPVAPALLFWAIKEAIEARGMWVHLTGPPWSAALKPQHDGILDVSKYAVAGHDDASLSPVEALGWAFVRAVEAEMADAGAAFVTDTRLGGE